MNWHDPGDDERTYWQRGHVSFLLQAATYVWAGTAGSLMAMHLHHFL